MDLDQETTELLYPVYDEDPLEVKNSDDEFDMEATEVSTFLFNAWVCCCCCLRLIVLS